MCNILNNLIERVEDIAYARLNNDKEVANINRLISYYLMASYLYQNECVSPIPDRKYDLMCKMILDNFDIIEHRHKYLIDKGMLEAGSGAFIDWEQAPLMIIGSARCWYRDGAPMPELDSFIKKRINMKNIFILSSSDIDGILAAKIINKKYPEATHLSSSRRDINLPEGSVLYLVRSYMGTRRILELAERYEIYIYDLTTVDEYKDAKLLESRGCVGHWIDPLNIVSEIVWIDMFGKDQKLQPRIIDFVHDYMRWEFKFEESLPTHYALEMIEPKFGNTQNILFNKILDDDKAIMDELLSCGTDIQKYYDIVFKCLLNELAFEADIDKVPSLCANISGVNSLFFSHYPMFDHFDIAMTFSYQPTTNNIRHTLYSINPEINVDKIAKTYKGGGHKGAAGFTWKQLPFKCIKSNSNSKPDYATMLNASIMSGNVIEYIKRKIHCWQRNVFYGTWKGKKAVFCNSPILTSTDFFENIDVNDCELKIQFCMVCNGMYRIACQSTNGLDLSDEYGDKYDKYRISILPDLTYATFTSANIEKDVFMCNAYRG